MKSIFLGLSLLLSTAYSAQSLDSINGLPVGTKAPLYTLQNLSGEKLDLKELNAQGPLLLVFYRGHWCPYCNRHLSELQEIADSLQELGVSLVAIAPEKPEYLAEMKKETGASFTFLYDEAYRMIKAYDLAFLPSEATRLKYKTFLGADLSELSGDSREWLPVPATFLIDSEGIIRWRHFNPDYKERSEVSEILEALAKLKLN
jgi:peroxiredoxin